MNIENEKEGSIPTHVVGIGASAGGLEALEKLFRAMPVDTGMAFVVIQHLSPDFRSLMDELLARFTSMPVVVIDGEIPMRANTIYLLPPRKDAVVEGPNLISHDRISGKQLSLPINTLFKTLALYWTEKAVAVVLSGTGSDGSEGVQHVREHGGAVVVQQPTDAKFDGMPLSSIATGCVDRVVAADEIPSVLLQWVDSPSSVRSGSHDELANFEMSDNPGIRQIYDMLRQQYSLDFKLYKPSTILRRIQRRASFGGVETGSLTGYAEKLKKSESELDLLYRDLLIGVTSFFRDVDAYSALASKAIQQDIEALPAGSDYRVWVCGCSTGEEAYSLAILLLEEFERAGKAPTVKLFATDVNREYLNVASEGVYAEAALVGLSEELRNKYFLPVGSGNFKVSLALRKLIIFSEHNLLRNPPFTRMNLVSCRNLLIYLSNEAQLPAITSFNFSLLSGGILFLGVSETLGAVAEDFEVVDRQWKVYRKIRESSLSLPVRPTEHVGQLMALDFNRQRNDGRFALGRLYQMLLDKYVRSGVIVSEDFDLLHVFGDEHGLLKKTSRTPNHDALSLMTEGLLALVEKLVAKLKGQVSQSADSTLSVEAVLDHEPPIEVKVERVLDKISGSSFFVVLWRSSTMVNEAEEISENLAFKDFSLPDESKRYLQELQLELKKTKEALQTNSEELETSNEELQASNEELQASNEELQSTNEELHSVNEELYTVNSELELKIVELDRTSSDLKNLVDSSQIGSIFLDDSYLIRIFSPLATEAFNFVPADIGRDIRSFTAKVSDPDLMHDLGQVYASGEYSERLIRSTVDSQRVYLRRCTPCRNAKGVNDGALVTYVDLTDLDESPDSGWWAKFTSLFNLSDSK